MSENVFEIICLLIPFVCGIITTFLIPYLKTKMSIEKTNEIIVWVGKAVGAAEVLFDVPQSGEQKREYVIDFIDNMFNKKRQVISKDQIRVLLESAWRELGKG